MDLRPYQIEALEAWDKFVDGGGKRGLMVLPTASGKTVVFAQLPKKYGRTLVLAHREELLDQAAEKLQAANPTLTVAVEAADRRAGSADLVVGSVPTLGRAGSKRIHDIGDFNLLVVDEAHHASPSNSTYKRVLDHFGHVPRLGVTATPQRGDHKSLAGVFDSIVYFRSIEDMIKEGWLVPPVGYRVKTGSDLSDVHLRGGEFVENELADAVDNQARNELAVSAYQELAIGRRAVVFAVNVAHGEHLAEAFRAAGVSCESVFGKTDKEIRKEVLANFAAGKISVLTNCAVLTEGWDDPGVSCLILARPTRSTLLYTQIIGRGLRLHPQKDDCLVIDLADACAGKKPVGLPTLMGLPDDMDLQGKKVHEVAEKYRELEEKSPEEASRVSSVDDLDAAFEKIDLFRPPELSAETAEFSKLIWMEIAHEHWVLNLGGDHRERINIQSDAIGNYVVSLQSNLGSKVLGKTDNMVLAFNKTDNWVRKNRDERMGLLNRDALWRNDKPTEKQIAILKKNGIPITADMTKGQASLILDKIFADKPRRQVPPWVKKKGSF
jgi:ATP-dependent helicase IRC3